MTTPTVIVHTVTITGNLTTEQLIDQLTGQRNQIDREYMAAEAAEDYDKARELRRLFDQVGSMIIALDDYAQAKADAQAAK